MVDQEEYVPLESFRFRLVSWNFLEEYLVAEAWCLFGLSSLNRGLLCRGLLGEGLLYLLLAAASGNCGFPSLGSGCRCITSKPSA